MATASLVVRLGVDLGNLKSGVSAASQELEKLKASAVNAGSSLVGAFPKTIGAEAKNIAGAVGSLVTSFGGLNAILGALAVGAVVRDFLDLTGSLTDLSAQTEISVKDLQRFKFAGEQVGVGLDAITTAVGQLQNRLGSGDKSAFAALDVLSLSIENLRRLDPGQQFEAIARAISQIPDPSQRAAIAMDLFGRSGVSLLPLLRSDIKAVGDSIAVMSDETVAAGDNFGDLLNKFLTLGKAFAAEELLGPIAKWAAELGAAFEDLGNNIEIVTGKAEQLPTILAKTFTGKGFQGPKLAFEEAMKVSDDLDKQLESQFRKQETRSQKAAADRRRIEEDNARLTADAVIAFYESTRIALKHYYDDLLLANDGIKAGVEDLTFRKNVELSTLTSLSDQWLAYREVIDSVNRQIRIGLDSAPGIAFTPEMIGGDFLKTAGKDAGLAFGIELSKAIIGAAQGGGGIGESVGAVLGDKLGSSLGKSLATAIGSKFGSTLGGMLGPLGAIGGQLLGGVFDKVIGKVFGKAGRSKVEEFAATFEGGFKGLQKALEPLGDEGARLWKNLTQGTGRNNPQQAQAAIDAVTAALERQKAVTEVLAPTYADVTAAAARYGLEVTQIGDAINSLRVMEMSQQAVKDWDLMARAGANMEEVAAGMSDEMQTLVDESIQWGHALPEAMRPILQKMVDMGLLTDDAGEKLVDLDRLKFEKPLVAAIDGLIGKMDELIVKISEGLGGALRGLPDLNMNVPQLGSGGIVRKPTLALVGESGPEAVVPLGSAGLGAQPIVVKNYTYLDGRIVAESTARHLPYVLGRTG